MSTPLPVCSSPASPPRPRLVADGREEASQPDLAAVASSIDAVRVRRLVAELPTLHRLVVTWRFGLKGLTLSRREIAVRLRLAPAVVDLIESEGLQMMREHALEERRAS